MGVEEETKNVATLLSEDYVKISPKKDHLFPEVTVCFEYLSRSIRFISSPTVFTKRQYVKLDATGIRKHFKRVFISEHTGFRKPDVNIFYYAQEAVKAKTEEWSDDRRRVGVTSSGPHVSGWDTVFFLMPKREHVEKVTFEIRNLEELKRIL